MSSRNGWKKKIPMTLIGLRLVLGFVVFGLSFLNISHYSWWAIGILIAAFLSDILDGIIARRLGVSSVKLRRLDATIDQIFFVCYITATYVQYPVFFKDEQLKIFLVVLAEIACYVIGFVRFRKEIATHSLGAKLWSIFLFATLIQITLTGTSALLFDIFFWTGLVSRLEIMLIILVIKDWCNDVPTIYHAVLLRKGKEIKRHKLFNG